MRAVCHRLHEFVSNLEVHTFPFAEDYIPMNGIYFLFEKGEQAHGTERIVRIGTHRGRNQLRGRLREHFLVENKDRSIFRKNIGRALLHKEQDPYLEVWNIDTLSRAKREEYKGVIDREHEKQIENAVTAYIHKNLSFAALPVRDKAERLSLERRLIGTVTQCTDCGPGPNWPGRHSPKRKIRESGLWQVQHLGHSPLSMEALDQLFVSFEPREVHQFDDPLLNLVAQHLQAPDGRNRSPEAYTGARLAGRRRTFLQSFREAYAGDRMSHEALARYTWSNLGWRMGAILRVATGGGLSPEEQKRYGVLYFDMMAHLYRGYLGRK